MAEEEPVGSAAGPRPEQSLDRRPASVSNAQVTCRSTADRVERQLFILVSAYYRLVAGIGNVEKQMFNVLCNRRKELGPFTSSG